MKSDKRTMARMNGHVAALAGLIAITGTCRLIAQQQPAVESDRAEATGYLRTAGY